MQLCQCLVYYTPIRFRLSILFPGWRISTFRAVFVSRRKTFSIAASEALREGEGARSGRRPRMAKSAKPSFRPDPAAGKY